MFPQPTISKVIALWVMKFHNLMLGKMKSHVIVINVMLSSAYANGAQNDSYSKI